MSPLAPLALLGCEPDCREHLVEGLALVQRGRPFALGGDIHEMPIEDFLATSCAHLSMTCSMAFWIDPSFACDESTGLRSIVGPSRVERILEENGEATLQHAVLSQSRDDLALAPDFDRPERG